MDLTVQNVYGLLIRSRLLPLEEAKAMFERWRTEAREQFTDLEQFTQWMVANQYVTDYQAALLARGHADHFFLDQYKILERIGRGRMAGVYKAVHSLGQVVAIKVLPPSRAKDPQMRARFQREARLALRLKHPNIVRAFQMGEYEGLHYLVMEYLEGETFDEVLQRRGKLPPIEAVRLIHQALLGLQHMHERGMVHRDLKPSNMMLVPARKLGEPDTTADATLKILDIGLGRALYDETASAKDIDQLTSEGALLGTPDYMSPEQARDARAIDIRTDIYSLGCVLYHTVAGQPPFPDTNIINQMIRHATETPRPLTEFNPETPELLLQVVSWMMAKDPNQRYPTPDRAAQTLRILLHSELATVRPPEAGQLRTPESDSTMQPYLSWLEQANGPEDQSQPPEPTPFPVAAPPAPAPVPERTTARTASSLSARSQATPPPPTSTTSVRRKERSDKHRVRKTQVPAAIPTMPRSARPPEVLDVELQPTPPTARAPATAESAFSLTRRDFLMLGIGAGGVILAAFVGWSLAQLFRRKPRAVSPTEPEPSAPNQVEAP